MVLQAQESVREFVSEWAAKHIPETDLSRIISLVHTELKGLHERNIARFRLRPAEFQAWREKKG